MSLVEAVTPSASSRYWPSPAATPASNTGAADDLALLLRTGSKIRFSRGETIFSEGDPADFAYSVVSGPVRLCKHAADGRRQIAQFLPISSVSWQWMNTASRRKPSMTRSLRATRGGKLKG